MLALTVKVRRGKFRWVVMMTPVMTVSLAKRNLMCLAEGLAENTKRLPGP